MTNNNHPITPPPERLQQWSLARGYSCPEELWDYIAIQAARWGADQELEACCEWLASRPSNWESTAPELAEDIRAARRPKPPSLKQQALEALQRAEEGWRPIPDDCDIIRRAIESLPDE